MRAGSGRGRSGPSEGTPHLVTWASDLTVHAEAIIAQLAGNAPGVGTAGRGSQDG
jgi:hypothetical protein